MVNIYSIEDFSFCEAVIFNIYTELIKNLLSRNLLFSKCFLEFWVYFIVVIWKFIDLKKRIEASYRRYELLFCNLAISIHIDYTNPFFNLIRRFIRHYLLESFLKLKYSNSFSSINVSCFIYLYWIDFSIPKKNT